MLKPFFSINCNIWVTTYNLCVSLSASNYYEIKKKCETIQVPLSKHLPTYKTLKLFPSYREAIFKHENRRADI